MIEAYAIGVAAKLEDGVTPGLIKIIDSLTRANMLLLEFSANLKRMSTAGLGLSRNMAKATRASIALGDSAGALTRASYVLDTMAVSSADIARNMAAARAAGTGMGGVPGGRVPGGGADYPRHYRGTTGRSAEQAGVATAGGIAYGIYENAKLDNIITRAVLTDGTPASQQAAAKQAYMERIRRESAKYGFASHGLADFADSYVSSSRLLRGMPDVERSDILDEIMPYAAQEAYLKQISLKESVSAFIGAAHMSGAYSGPEIKAMLPALISASLSTNASMQRIENAAGYAVPILRTGLGIDPAKVFTMIALMQRAGIQNTKSGTWIADLFMNAVPKNFGSGLFKSSNQIKALQQLGLMDGQNKLTYLDGNGNLDPLKMLKIAAEHSAKLTPTERSGAMKRAFGMQGARALALFTDPKMMAMMPLLEAAEKHLENPADTLKQAQSGNAAAQGKQTLTNAQMTITNATATFMGPVNAVLSAASSGSADMANFAQKNPGITLGGFLAATFGTLLIGKSAWGLSKLIFRGVGTVLSRLVTGAFVRVAAMSGIKLGASALAAIGEGAALIGSLGVVLAGGLGYMLGSLVQKALPNAFRNGIGSYIAHAMAMLGDPEAKEAVKRMDAVTLPPAATPVVVHTQINLDGKPVAKAVTRHQAEEMKRPQAGTTRHDGGMSLRPVGASGNW